MTHLVMKQLFIMIHNETLPSCIAMGAHCARHAPYDKFRIVVKFSSIHMEADWHQTSFQHVGASMEIAMTGDLTMSYRTKNIELRFWRLRSSTLLSTGWCIQSSMVEKWSQKCFKAEGPMPPSIDFANWKGWMATVGHWCPWPPKNTFMKPIVDE